MTAFVKGFGCRPYVIDRPALRAGVRKPPRKEPAGAARGLRSMGILMGRGFGEAILAWAESGNAAGRLRIGRRRCTRPPDCGVTGGIAPAFAGAGRKGRGVGNGCSGGRRLPSSEARSHRLGSDPGLRDGGPRGAPPRSKNSTMIMRPPQQGHGGHRSAAAPSAIGGVVRCRRLCRQRRGGDQLPGSRDVGFAAGAGEQPVVADAVKSFGQDVEQEAPDELVGASVIVRYRACPSRR